MLFQVLIFVLCVTISSQCFTNSFENVNIEIEELSEKYKLVVNSCLNSSNLKSESDLKEIKMNGQQIEDLNKGAVMSISAEFKIDFSKNEISVIRTEAFFELPKLTEIDLSENQISWIGAGAFSDLPSLSKIVLKDNKATLQQSCFNNLPVVNEINLDGNGLKHFDQEWFSNTPSLTWLWLRHNLLTSIPKAAFIDLPSLKQIHFDNNQLVFIDKNAFKGLKNLERVYFSSNRLKNFDINFHTPSKIVYMGIQFNNVSYISDIVLNAISPSIQKFWITSNPLQCACLDKLMKWAVDSRTEIAMKCRAKDVVCVLPKTNPDQCIERSEAEFHEGYSDTFGSEWTCAPGDDY